MTSLQQRFSALMQALCGHILGQSDFIHKLCTALLADGHLLIEAPPGLAKTRAVKALGHCIEGSFHRIQFTPDLLPADLTGSDVFRPQDASFVFKQGPLFHHLLLADEINRAPAKVQSALLEAMAEKQITVGDKTYRLPPLFMVIATQNSIEQQGTYPLPEAQLDRFLMTVHLDYPDAETEKNILEITRQETLQDKTRLPQHMLSQQMIFEARQQILSLHVSDALMRYMVELVAATRAPQSYDPKLSTLIRYGASPRGTIALDRCARAHAWLAGRDHVLPEDIRAVVYPVLRHRLLLTHEAHANQVSSDDVITALLSRVTMP